MVSCIWLSLHVNFVDDQRSYGCVIMRHEIYRMLLLLVFTREFQMMNNELEQMNNGLILVLQASQRYCQCVGPSCSVCNKTSK